MNLLNTPLPPPLVHVYRNTPRCVVPPFSCQPPRPVTSTRLATHPQPLHGSCCRICCTRSRPSTGYCRRVGPRPRHPRRWRRRGLTRTRRSAKARQSNPKGLRSGRGVLCGKGAANGNTSHGRGTTVQVVPNMVWVVPSMTGVVPSVMWVVPSMLG